MFGDDFVASLTEFYSVEQIKAYWKQAFDAFASRVTTVIHITSRTREGSSASGITLAKPEDYQAFISACRRAIDKLENGNSVSADQLSSRIDFSRRIVGT